MKSVVCVTRSEQETTAMGMRLGSMAAAGDVYLLTGELGVGKTCLIRGIAAGLGVTEHAFSPSFVLVREYHGRLPLFHMDLYRLTDLDEIAELGLEDYLEGDGVCAIEWADRARGILPSRNLTVELAYDSTAEDARLIRFEGIGARYETLISHFVADAGEQLSWN